MSIRSKRARTIIQKENRKFQRQGYSIVRTRKRSKRTFDEEFAEAIHIAWLNQNYYTMPDKLCSTIQDDDEKTTD